MNGRVHIVPPAIDPLAPKNMALSPEDAVYVCNQFGLDMDRPLICQVSRFDPWKDPIGVIDAYRLVKEKLPDVQLALVGSMATDDPEGWDFFNDTIAHAEGDPDVHILNNFNNVGAIEVNAFQSHADVLVQKSTREGFGLTVSEAIWKAKPFIGGNVGGIPLQVRDGETGFLVSSVQECARSHRRRAGRPGPGQGPGPPRQGARARPLPDAPAAARLAADPAADVVDGGACRNATASMAELAAPGAGLQPRAGDVRGGRRDEPRGRRPGHRADRPGLAPRRGVGGLGHERARLAPGAPPRRAARSPCSRPAGASTASSWSTPTPRPTSASTRSSPTRSCGSSSTTCGTCPMRPTSAARRWRRSSSATTSSTRTWRAPSWRRSRARTSRW